MLSLSPISPCILPLYMSKCYIPPFFNFLSGVYTLGYAVLTEMGFLVFRMLMGVRAGSGKRRKTPDPRLRNMWYAWNLMPQHIVFSFNCTFTKISRSQHKIIISCHEIMFFCLISAYLWLKIMILCGFLSIWY